MLLKYSLMDREQQVLEQLMFTQLSMDIDSSLASDEALNLASSASVSMPMAEPSSLSSKAAKANSVPANTTLEVEAEVASDLNQLDDWRFENLPAGFKVVKVIPQAANNNVHQIVLSDGVAAVSVFIASATAAKNIDQLSYASGATHILGLELAGHMITFVGEVPESTLQAIQKGLRYVAQ
jgi:sigma-E factor negative regulatory protein RseB